jgi:general secretion pathway protein L
LVRSDRFIFKPLELPARAAEFLSGVVRAQIDRLTPWSADQAAFGFGPPTDAGSGRIVVTVAATAKSMLTPIVKALSNLGARSVVVRTAAPNESETAPITVMEENVAHVLDAQLVRRILLVTLVASWLIAALTMTTTIIIDGNLQARQDELARQIAKERAAMLTARNNPGDPKTIAERALLRRKNESPSDVIALEILSQILPDDTYVTEMHIESNRVRLTGVTHDAPQLIRLIERTRHFSQATFYAPITHSSSNPGDHFSIEARMEPNFSLTP